jgi:hypothetical protein
MRGAGGDEKWYRWKRSRGRLRYRWEKSPNIEMDLRETGFRGVDRIHLAQDRDRWRTVVNAVMDFKFHRRRGISWLKESTLSLSPRIAAWSWLVEKAPLVCRTELPGLAAGSPEAKGSVLWCDVTELRANLSSGRQVIRTDTRTLACISLKSVDLTCSSASYASSCPNSQPYYTIWRVPEN